MLQPLELDLNWCVPRHETRSAWALSPFQVALVYVLCFISKDWQSPRCSRLSGWKQEAESLLKHPGCPCEGGSLCRAGQWHHVLGSL